MAYQKLQVGTVWGPVIQNNNVDIPEIGTVAIPLDDAVTLTGATATTLTATGTDFEALGVESGMIVVQVNAGKVGTTKANIVQADGDTLIIDGANTNFGGTDDIAIFGPPAPQQGCVLYIGGDSAGVVDVEVMTSSGTVGTFKSVSVGSFFPVQVKRLLTSTSADAEILALW